MNVYTVIVTGASGSVYGLRLVERLLLAGHAVSLVLTDTGRDVAAYELDLTFPEDDAEAAVLDSLELPQGSSAPTTSSIRSRRAPAR